MSDDSFFREVNEEIRQDRVKALWTRFGAYILAAIAIVLLATIAVVAWDRYEASLASASGDRYLAALKLAQSGKPDEAVTQLRTIADNGYGAYPDLARMSIGAVLADEKKPAEAVAVFDKVANDPGAPQPMRDMASIRAAYILVDTGSLAEVRDRVERLSGDSEPLRFPAREAIALAAWKAGDTDTAKPLFQKLVDDQGTPNGIRTRARVMLDLIQSGETSPKVAASAAGAAAEGAATASNGAGPGSAAGARQAAPAGGGATATAVPAMPTTSLGMEPAGAGVAGTANGATAAGDAAAGGSSAATGAVGGGSAGSPQPTGSTTD